MRKTNFLKCFLLFCLFRNSFFVGKLTSEKIVQKALLISLCDWKEIKSLNQENLRPTFFFAEEFNVQWQLARDIAKSGTGRKV